MNSTDFKAIRKWWIIEILYKKQEIEVCVLKAGNSLLVCGTYITRIRKREKGLYQTVGPADVIRVVMPFGTPESSNTEAIKQKAVDIIEAAEDIADLA